LDESFLNSLENRFRLNKNDSSFQKSRSILKIYDKNEFNKNDSERKKMEIKEILNLNRKEIQNINEIIIYDDYDKNQDLEKEIEEFFKQNEPKSKGWLLRKKGKCNQKMSNFFFSLEKQELKLLSIKLTKMKVFFFFFHSKSKFQH
jgi:hypothetical protein